MTETAPAVNPNALADRAAMGLPDSFVDRIDQDHFAEECSRLAAAGTAALAGTAEDPSLPYLTRLAAGSLLALLGDPRIRLWSPVMLDVPAAWVRLGLPADRIDEIVARWSDVGVVRSWIAKEAPSHEVDLAAFRIARYPVTNAEYRTFLMENPAVTPPSSWQFGVYPAALANHPVWTVSPQDADAYAAWLSMRTGRNFRLPSEAEWEYAAAGEDGREYPWGEETDADRANTVEAGPLLTTPVGIHPAGRSPFGADDMAGNVEEYVSDDYRPYPGGAAVRDDLTRSEGETYRVARGGSFTRYGDLARCRRRHGWYHRPIYVMGFRLAESPARGLGEGIDG
jgi:formylglycine-generating enzyme required for sulfatase activity